ncbi:MAG: insulinase family protein [Paludibacter sp.]
MKKYLFLLISFISLSLNAADISGFKSLILDNGLTVYLWEDKNQPDITGRLVVRAGSIDEPLEYTGLAHYLEHLLFKGTTKIGALNWAKEKPLYEDIIKLYDEYSSTKDPVLRDTLTKKINRESIESAKYSNTSDFSNLIEGMGGEGLNAGTNYDQTVFYNNFPPFQLEKWLDVNSERLINPVFRSFQAELENVFEEYNMYQDNRNTHVSNFIISHLYPNDPYGRDVIGNPDHLKNPRLSKLIEFYNSWYVPENMALVLVGNFDSEQAISLIKAKFGRLESHKVPERVSAVTANFEGNPKFSAKLSYYPQVVWGYSGVKKGDKDELLLEICTNILNNTMKTGLLDKLSLNGDVTSAQAFNDARRNEGRIMVMAIPYFDVNQKMYESDKATEKTIMTEVDKLKNGNIEDWLIKSVKDNMLREYDLVMETPSAKTEVLTELFSYNLPVSEFFSRNERINAITKAEIQRAAKQYFSGNHVTISIEEGTPDKEKLKKPDIKPLDQPKGQITEYAQYVQKMPIVKVNEEYNDFSDVKSIKLYDGINLFCTKNKQNDIFTLTLKYGIGTTKMPKLEYATQLMNSAGILPSSDAQSVRRQFSELNTKCTYAVTDDYFYILLQGDESNLAAACNLMTRQILMPKLDDKQLDRVKGTYYQNRVSIEKNDVEVLSDALNKYVLYKDSSSYIDRLKLSDVLSLKISELTGEIIRATDYDVDIHYVGKTEANEVADILKSNLPLKEGVKKSESPFVKDRISYSKPMVYFLPNSSAQQAKIYFYINGSEYNPENKVIYDAFNQYFSGGFNGLVMNEIRENNSMAYTAYGAEVTPPIPTKKAYFIGFVGTQGDKAADAIDLYMKLLTDMPLYPDKIENIRTYLRQSSLTDKPSFRTKSQVFNRWKLLGYTEDPAKVNMPKIDNLTFDQIVAFYNKEIKGKPISIIITGDPKTIDLKQIKANQGNITKLSSRNLFNVED